MNTQKKNRKSLNLEVQEIERQAKPGCGTSTTSHLCTCPVRCSTV